MLLKSPDYFMNLIIWYCLKRTGAKTQTIDRQKNSILISAASCSVHTIQAILKMCMEDHQDVQPFLLPTLLKQAPPDAENNTTAL